jgi:glycosyltransferase domain-containing protein
LDSSSNVLDDEVKPYLDRKTVSYKKYDSSIFFANKISDGCQSITTPYAVLCADDDFLIPAGILESRSFLQENQDYASAHGMYFIHTSSDEVQNNGFSIGPLYQNGSSSEQDSTEKRLYAYLSGATGYYPMYAVHRADLFKKIWIETTKYVFDWGLSELFPCALSFIYGKMKVLPVFYESREPNTYTWYDENRHRGMYSEEKLDKAVAGIAKHLSLVEGIPDKDATQIAESAFQGYLERVELKMANRSNGSTSTWLRLRQKVRFRTRLRQMFWQGCYPSIYPEYFDDYLKVKEAVLSANLTQEELNVARRDLAKQ